MARMAPSSQESAEWPAEHRSAMGTLNNQKTSGKNVTEQLEGRCVIGRAPSDHEADEQSSASKMPSGSDVTQLVCFCWMKALSANSDHCNA